MPRLILSVAFASASFASIHAQNSALTFHNLAAAPTVQRAGATFKVVVTPSGSLLTGALPRDYRQAPHHHSQEQIQIGLGGEFAFTIAGEPHPIARYTAAIPPSNVEHFMTNGSGQEARMLEYQPVERRDWISPVPAAPQTQPAAPLRTRREVVKPLLSNDWTVDEVGTRTTSFAGETVGVRLIDLSAPAAMFDATTGQARVQRFVYVFDGDATVVTGTTTREVTEEMCIEIPQTSVPVIVRSRHNGAMVGVFEPLSLIGPKEVTR